MLLSGRDAYDAWAPEFSKWSVWAKPTPFVIVPPVNPKKPEIPEVDWLPEAERHRAVVIDIAGAGSVLAGLAAAQKGYRPVPLYNGVTAPYEELPVIDTEPVVQALFDGVSVLNALVIPPDAPPAFLLDSNRLEGVGKDPGTFDNRWSIFPQDMSSPAYMAKNGITEILLYCCTVREDLAMILVKYSENGIKTTVNYETGKIVEGIDPPWRLWSTFYRLGVMAGLRRNPAGGFGGKVPVQNESNGVIYYGVG